MQTVNNPPFDVQPSVSKNLYNSALTCKGCYSSQSFLRCSSRVIILNLVPIKISISFLDRLINFSSTLFNQSLWMDKNTIFWHYNSALMKFLLSFIFYEILLRVNSQKWECWVRVWTINILTHIPNYPLGRWYQFPLQLSKQLLTSFNSWCMTLDFSKNEKHQ